MNKMKVQKHAIKTGTIETYIMVFILVLVLFQVIAGVFPEVTGAAEDLNASGFPLASFFMASGPLWLLVAAGLLFMIYKSFAGSKK